MGKVVILGHCRLSIERGDPSASLLQDVYQLDELRDFLPPQRGQLLNHIVLLKSSTLEDGPLQLRFNFLQILLQLLHVETVVEDPPCPPTSD